MVSIEWIIFTFNSKGTYGQWQPSFNKASRWSVVNNFNYNIQMNFLYAVTLTYGKYDRSTIFS